MLDWLLDWLTAFLVWLLDVLLWVPLKLWNLFLDAVLALFYWIPVPDFISGASTWLSQLPASVGYFLQITELGFGLGVVITASVIRFVIRRLPVVG